MSLFSNLKNSATVYSKNNTQDSMMGSVPTNVVLSSIGANGLIIGSLQSLGGTRQETLQGRFAAVVDFVFYCAAKTVGFSTLTNGCMLSCSDGRNYDTVHWEDEAGLGFSQVIYLRRID